MSKSKSITITDYEGKVYHKDGYIRHFHKDGYVHVRYMTEDGSNGYFSKKEADIKDINIDVTVVLSAPIEHIDVTVTVELSEEDKLIRWFGTRFPNIKHINRNVITNRKDKDGNLDDERNGTFTTVVLDDGRVGKVKVQNGSEDNIELGILWAYTKATEKKKKTFKNDVLEQLYTMAHNNPCSEISMSGAAESGIRDANLMLACAGMKRHPLNSNAVYSSYLSHMLR